MIVHERSAYRPPTADEIAADLAAIEARPERPHAGADPWPGGTHHDHTTCATCGPVMDTVAWMNGAERATHRHEFLPMSSSGDARPGRDGYDTGDDDQ